jgi:hypothetical protein
VNYVPKTKRQQRIDEFCDRGNLEPHRDVLTRILDDLGEDDVSISARYDALYSAYEPYLEQGKFIRVSLLNVEIPLDVIWIMLHEYGHYESGAIQPNDTQIYREELAWEYARKRMQNYPELAIETESFEKCRQRCLNSYYRKHGLKEI